MTITKKWLTSVGFFLDKSDAIVVHVYIIKISSGSIHVFFDEDNTVNDVNVRSVMVSFWLDSPFTTERIVALAKGLWNVDLVVKEKS